MEGSSGRKFNVGGVWLDQPFRIRRMGHFGFNMADVEKGLAFYRDVIGFQVSDPLDFKDVLPDPAITEGIDDTTGYFMRHGNDHHSFVVFPRPVMDRLSGGHAPPEVTVNQITWQVGSLKEVGDATDWFDEQKIFMPRRGRDTPGSNWHAYPMDPEGHTNELYYGMEQIGWDGLSKPPESKERGFMEKPDLPQIPEYQEIDQFRDQGVDLYSGYRHEETQPAIYDVGGISLPRPFKITRIGPVRLFVDDMDSMLAYYTDTLGLSITEEVIYEGHRCVFLRANTDHHSIGLYPIALRKTLGLSSHSTCMSFGIQVGSYQQLRDALAYLADKGAEIKHLPEELSPGIDYSAYVMDPDGHLLQFYWYMEQVGWDGRPRPASERRKTMDPWPEALEPMSDVYGGEAFMGPLG